MATFRLLHFSSPETLAAIDRRRLIAFLDPYRDFFRSHGIEIPARGSDEELDHDALVRAFMSPDEATPKELIDALYFVDGMSTSSAMERLLEKANLAGLMLDRAEEVSPADFAVQIWLLDLELLERVHAEQFLLNPKTFVHYQTDASDDEDEEEYPKLDDEKHRQLESALNDWFEQHKRGRTARVFCFPHDDSFWFLVRHGEPYKREGSVVGDEPSSVAYRPLKHDVLVYTPALKELRINAQLKGERSLYRTEFGRYFFGGPNYFQEIPKYTLEPLRVVGEPALTCMDITGMEWIRLKELHYDEGGTYKAMMVSKATDLFAWLREQGETIPETPALAKAIFQVKFTDVKRERTVAITPPNRAQYTRDEDWDPVEQWLRKRGFMNVHEDTE